MHRFNAVMAAIAATAMAVNAPGIHRAHASRPVGQAPAIRITQVPTVAPGPDSWGTITGTASGIHGEDNVHAVVYALGAGTGLWYVQPWTVAYMTPINNGAWSTGTHGGDEFAVLLVRGHYDAPATFDELPPIGGKILAEARRTP